MNKNELVKIRNVELTDYNFIFATMLRGLYYGDTWYSQIPKDIFMKNYHNVVEHLLKKPTVSILVACLKEDESTVLGYSILENNIVHYVFVKSAWRNIKIAKSLVPDGVQFVTHLTKVGNSILKKYDTVKFNPFII